MLRCKDVTTLVGTEALAHAGRLTRVRVRVHLLWCRHCQAYVRSLAQLAAMARHVVASGSTASEAREAEVLDAVRRAIVARVDRSPPEASPEG